MPVPRCCQIIALGWLLVGQRWAGVDAWEELTARPEAFRTESACSRYRRHRVAKATSSDTRWQRARCVTEAEFRRYPRSESGDFRYPGNQGDEPDETTRRRLRELGYSP